jgi:hypothetical protein
MHDSTSLHLFWKASDLHRDKRLTRFKKSVICLLYFFVIYILNIISLIAAGSFTLTCSPWAYIASVAVFKQHWYYLMQFELQEYLEIGEPFSIQSMHILATLFSSDNFSPNSFNWVSVWKIIPSASFNFSALSLETLSASALAMHLSFRFLLLLIQKKLRYEYHEIYLFLYQLQKLWWYH